jgi:hypothetical protein
MNNLHEVVEWTEEYMSLVYKDFHGLLPVQRAILEKSRDLILNNAAGHIAEHAPLDFISLLPYSGHYFFSRSDPWWIGYV